MDGFVFLATEAEGTTSTIDLPAYALVTASVRSSYLWKYMRVFMLTTPIQSIGDLEYTEFVDGIGEDTSGARRSLGRV